MSDEKREQFEQWAEEVGALPWGYLKRHRNPSGGYSIQIYTYMWQAWQAWQASSRLDSEPQKRDIPLSQAVAELRELKKRTASIMKRSRKQSGGAMTEESREQFEQAFKNWHPDSTGPYIKHIAEYFWKESRAALVVELPTQEKYDDPLSAYTAIRDCKGILSAAGITVKGEGDE